MARGSADPNLYLWSSVTLAPPISIESDPLADALRLEKARALCGRLKSVVATFGSVNDRMLLSAVGTMRRFGVEESPAVEMLLDALPESLAPRVERIAAIAFGMSCLSDAPARGPAWQLKPIFAEGHAGLLVGPSGGGKTNLLAATAISAASGGELFGRRFLGPIGVLILAGEAADEIPERLRAASVEIGLNPDRLPVMCAPCCDSRDIELHVQAASLRLRQDFQLGVGLVALDSLQSIYGLQDEEDPSFAWATMQGLRRLAERFDACFVLAHHAGKRDSRPRGSQAWADAANFILQIDAEQDWKTGEFRKRRLRLTKSRHSGPLDLGAFRIEDGPAGGVLRFGEASLPAASKGAVRPEKHRQSKGAATSADRLQAALMAAREAGEAIELAGRPCVSVDIAERFYLGDRPAPSRARNLRRDVLAAATKAGVRRIDSGGVIYFEIPGAP